MTKKIKYILLLSFLIILGLCTKSQARITTSDPTVESGGTATITINSQEAVASGSIDVTSDGGLTFVSASGGTANGTLLAFANSTNKTSGIATYTFRVPEVSETTTYRVTFASSDMADENGATVASSSATATVTVRGTSSSSSSGSSSSSNNSSGNSSSSSNTPSFTEVNETVYATSSVNVRSSYSTSSSVVGSLNAGDSVTRTGRGSNGWSRVRYNGQTAYISSEYLTTEKPEESNNKNLESITIEGDYTLSPEFSTDVTEYELTVGTDVDSLQIEAVAEDDNAEVSITGNDNLLMGENTIEIEVTAEDGTVRTYTINVTKGASEEETTGNGLVLSTLTLDGYELTPNFSSDIYEYTLNIYDSSVTNINIDATSNVEDAVIEIAGNNDLKLGENVITILVTSGENVTTYQIVVNIMEKVENQIIAGIDNNDLFLYGGIALAVIIVIIIIIVVVKRRKNKKDDDFEPYYGGLDSLNLKDEPLDKEEKLNDNKIGDKLTNNIDYSYNSINNDEMSEKTYKKDRKSVIEENFGADINNDDFDDDKPKRKKGKHF